MIGHIVSTTITDERKEGTMFVYWSQGSWKILRFPKSQDKRRKLREYIRSKPKELLMRTTVDGIVVDFPLVTTQWERAAEHASIDNPNCKFEFRIVSRHDDPMNLNLAIIEESKEKEIRAGDKVVFVENWGKHVSNDYINVILIRKGSEAVVVQVSDDGNSFCVQTAIGKFSWIRKKFIKPNKVHRFMRSIADVF